MIKMAYKTPVIQRSRRRDLESRSVGSNPAGSIFVNNKLYNGCVVQRIRRSPSERDDGGSNPLASIFRWCVLWQGVKIRSIVIMVRETAVYAMTMVVSNRKSSKRGDISKLSGMDSSSSGSGSDLLSRSTWDRYPPNPL